MIAGVCSAAVGLGAGRTWAQAYPAKPVRVLVGYAAGGVNDLLTRLIGQFLAERLGQTFVIENRPDAGSNIAAEAAALAPTDGYTLFRDRPPTTCTSCRRALTAPAPPRPGGEDHSSAQDREGDGAASPFGQRSSGAGRCRTDNQMQSRISGEHRLPAQLSAVLGRLPIASKAIYWLDNRASPEPALGQPRPPCL